MALELLERDLVLATVMPGHGEPTQPGGDEAAPEEETGDEEEAEPS
jgi:hypothetical protein